jgi:hypothetical protein
VGPDQYFIPVYDIPEHRVTVEDFGSDGDEAAAAYAEFEAKYRDRTDIEVLMVGADSLETIRKTHSHYFQDRVDTDRLVRDVVAQLREQAGRAQDPAE